MKVHFEVLLNYLNNPPSVLLVLQGFYRGNDIKPSVRPAFTFVIGRMRAYFPRKQAFDGLILVVGNP